MAVLQGGRGVDYACVTLRSSMARADRPRRRVQRPRGQLRWQNVVLDPFRPVGRYAVCRKLREGWPRLGTQVSVLKHWKVSHLCPCLSQACRSYGETSRHGSRVIRQNVFFPQNDLM